MREWYAACFVGEWGEGGSLAVLWVLYECDVDRGGRDGCVVGGELVAIVGTL